MKEARSGRRPGRPRNEETDKAILQTARELIMENGTQSFSMDALAQRAGVSKPTIYRRWPTKDELVTDVYGYASEQTVIPDTGDALADLLALLEQMLQSFAARIGSPAASSHKMIAGLLDSPQIMEQYRANFIAPRRAAYSEIIRRGKRRGEIREDADEDILIDLVSGAYLYCLLFKPAALESKEWLHSVHGLMAVGVAKR